MGRLAVPTLQVVKELKACLATGCGSNDSSAHAKEGDSRDPVLKLVSAERKEK